MATEIINPVAMVVREFKRSNLDFNQLGQRLGREPASVQWMFTRDNMSVERLIACCNALNYNFFLEIGYQIPRHGPENMAGNPLHSVVNSLTAKVKEDELTITELKQKLNAAEIKQKKTESEAEVQQRILETELNTLKQVMKDILASRQI
jgi:hypothetical protein